MSNWYYDQLVEKHGEAEAKRIMASNGRSGGSVKNKKKGFGSNPKLASKAGKKGKKNDKVSDDVSD